MSVHRVRADSPRMALHFRPTRTWELARHRTIFLLDWHSISQDEVRLERRARGTATCSGAGGGYR
jgi:hypothetical protein